ncbi:WxL protein peptidoglycan domain-containing protein [Dactylosporangium sp. CA-092794]|uniref:WxL protein peptidoglycan domain-containing protein n=1 Tax=Dactylosporangium sp. CA-092794 TaxID=3239929 RepID=UPI003D932F0A
MSGIVLLPAVLVAVAATAARAEPSPGTADNVTWGAAPANTNLGANRAHFTYTLPAGTAITDAIAVANYGKAPISLKVYASDAFTTSTGAIDLLAANRRPVDAGAWITIKTPQVTLQPQESVVVPFTLTVPAGATPGDHTAGIVTSLATGGPGSVNLDRRLGSRVYLRVPGALSPALGVGGVRVGYRGTLNPVEPGTATVTYTVTNTGNVRLRARQTLRVAGPFGLLGRAVDLGELPEILPGGSLTRTVDVPRVWPAVRLTATVELRPVAGAEAPTVSLAPVSGTGAAWAGPWGQAIVLIIVAAAVAGWLWQRRRSRRKVATAISTAVTKALEGASPPA